MGPPCVGEVARRLVVMSRKYWLRGVLVVAMLGFLALNGLAWQHAWTMTHYTPAGRPPPTIESLPWWGKARVLLFGIAVARPQNGHTPRDVGLDYTVHRVASADGGAVETWIVEQPRARGVVLLFPGYASSKDSLLVPALRLHNLGYTVVLADFRGAGGSTGSDTTLGVREAADVATVFGDAHSRWSGQPIVLYGVSMGSAAILHAVATKGVAPDALILESPFDRLLGTVSARFRAFGVPATPAAELLVFWGGVQQRQNGFAFNPVEDARRVTCPTLVLHGSRDPRATTAQATAVFAQLGGARQFVAFPDAGHELLVVTAPNEWQNAVERFLAEQPIANEHR